ncbi:hypothetical protein EET67_24790 [Pseudaminobacter arsenicus]|uniref:Uncharacterized protein n=1 Tax=Borborobacter arsenicus TaxID=1851146 RepID=A0A432UZ34_9HYPH|nr:hypothetical protein [Pseudaminobacter arsenicus]RUM95170.1 hypothetical protein EET67_24790 [Pseudaminobacter arsenicus]
MIRTKAVSGLPANVDANLPALVKRAADQLASATSAAEVLEACDMASVAYDASKKAARLAKAKGAHDELIAKAHRAQADALLIESEAKRRLADEYDAAQERGEIGRRGDYGAVTSGAEVTPATAADAGLTHKDIHEARAIRDAEKVDPGVVERTLEKRLDAGQEPTKAALREAIQKVRDETRESLPQAIKDMEAAKQKAIADRKASKDATPLYNGLPADDRIAELEEAVRVLEAEAETLRAENKLYGEMKVQYEQGGFEKVIAGKDEEIRALLTRVESESQEKVRNLRAADRWRKRAIELGYTDREIIEING